MKELFREADFTIVGYYRSILEANGILAFIRNEYEDRGYSSIAVTDSFPALCVINDEDYEEAMAIVREYGMPNASGSEEEYPCSKCGESNPGNFEVCWSCETPVEQETPGL